MDGWMDGCTHVILYLNMVKISHNKVMVFGEAVFALPRSIAY